MSLKILFEQDELDPQLEALDLMTSYHATIRFLEFFQHAIFSKEQQSRSVLDLYCEYLYSLGLINTQDDYPCVLSGRSDNPNENQAVRNLKFPMGLGSLAAYMSVNLGIAKEIASNKIPNKISEQLKSEWFLDEFDLIKDELFDEPTINRVITRLRNAVSHHKFKLRVPLHLKDETDIKDRVEVTFYDAAGKGGKEFYAKARFRTVEKLMEKLRSSVYVFHSCPQFDGDIYEKGAIIDYVTSCFEHFSRSYTGRGLKFKELRFLHPIDAHEARSTSGCLEFSIANNIIYEVLFTLNDKACNPQYIGIPLVAKSQQGEIMIEGELYYLGDYPMEWMLTHEKSPLCRLDKKIIGMLDSALETQLA